MAKKMVLQNLELILMVQFEVEVEVEVYIYYVEVEVEVEVQPSGRWPKTYFESLGQFFHKTIICDLNHAQRPTQNNFLVRFN